MDFKNSNKLLFICASAGNGGHRLGRIISCFDNVHWYANPRNGLHPWEVFYDDVIKGKSISPYHYDRLTPEGMIPLVGERIEKYWLEKDHDYFYDVVWHKLMLQAGADKIIESGKLLTWIVHDDHGYIKSKFPNSKVLNLIDDDIDLVVDRYLNTTALFPASIDDKKIKPEYLSEYSLMLEEIKKGNKNPRIKDIWAWKTYGNYFFQSYMLYEYRDDVEMEIRSLDSKKNVEIPGTLDLKWSNFNTEKIMEFIGSKLIDPNYIKLL